MPPALGMSAWYLGAASAATDSAAGAAGASASSLAAPFTAAVVSSFSRVEEKRAERDASGARDVEKAEALPMAVAARRTVVENFMVNFLVRFLDNAIGKECCELSDGSCCRILSTLPKKVVVGVLASISWLRSKKRKLVDWLRIAFRLSFKEEGEVRTHPSTSKDAVLSHQGKIGTSDFILIPNTSNFTSTWNL